MASDATNLPDNALKTTGIARRRLLKALGGLGIGGAVFHRSLAAQVEEKGELTNAMLKNAEWIADIELEDEQRSEILRGVKSILESGKRLRDQEVDADTVPVLVFRPDFFYSQAGSTQPERPPRIRIKETWQDKQVKAGSSDEELAFSSMTEQAQLLRQGKVSSRELTENYLKRLQKYDPLLECVVTMLEEHALQLADESDQRRKRGQTLGRLDGIPWVAKDLIAVPPYKTTWGAEPFKDQIRESQATVSQKLDANGAVLLAKVTLGALAWGDVWFGGKTRNPWNPSQGSSGSSAGSAASVAAGLATFALGSETYGSIVSPTRRCRVSGLRPTFGRVSRAGCMPLSWSMDKIGPIARTVEDLAFIFPALLGLDGKDPTLVERDYAWPSPSRKKKFKIGLTGDRLNSSEQAAVEFFKAQGAEFTDFSLDFEQPLSAMLFNLGTEASTVFDDAFRAEPDANFGQWPETFRESQFVPAIQYLRANRMRGEVIVEAEKRFREVDFIIGGNDLLLTNLSGHPSIVVTCNTVELGDRQVPGVVKLTSRAYGESTLLQAGMLLQENLPTEATRPPLDDFLKAAAEKENSDQDE